MFRTASKNHYYIFLNSDYKQSSVKLLYNEVQGSLCSLTFHHQGGPFNLSLEFSAKEGGVNCFLKNLVPSSPTASRTHKRRREGKRRGVEGERTKEKGKKYESRENRITEQVS